MDKYEQNDVLQPLFFLPQSGLKWSMNYIKPQTSLNFNLPDVTSQHMNVMHSAAIYHSAIV